MTTRIFMSGSMRGGRKLLDTYKFMLDVMLSAGTEVLSPHVANAAIFEEEKEMSEAEIFSRDMGGVQQCDLLVAEVTVPSVGVGYEICRAVDLGKPVLCVYQDGARASAMVLGNPGVTAKNYSSLNELKEIIQGFLCSFWE